MHRSLPLLLFSALLASFAMAEPPSKADFQKLYDKLSKAFETKSETEFLSLLSPEFQQVQNGKPPVTKAQIANLFQKETSTFRSVHWYRQVLKVTVDVPNYDVYVSSHLLATIVEKGQPHTYAIDSKSLDTWNPSMKIQQSRVMKLSIVKDGKRITLH